MSEELEVLDEEQTELKPYDPKFLDITPQRMASRVYSFGKGQYQVTDIDAKGIKTIALRCGISVTKVTYKETSDGKGYYFTAKAENLITKQKGVDHCFQSKEMKYRDGRTEFDENALAKGATRVVRRVRRQLIPEEIVDQAIEYAMIGKNTPDAVGTAKIEAQEARDRAKLALKEMGINAKVCYDDAQEQMGPAENWGAAEWYALRDKYLDPETEFAHLQRVAKQKQAVKQAVEPEPAPEMPDRQKAINEVQAITAKMKEDKPLLAVHIFDDEGRIKQELLGRWFGKQDRAMDVGEIMRLHEIMQTLMNGSYIYTFPDQTGVIPLLSEEVINVIEQVEKLSQSDMQPDEIPVEPEVEVEDVETVFEQPEPTEHQRRFRLLISSISVSEEAVQEGLSEADIHHQIMAAFSVKSELDFSEETLTNINQSLQEKGLQFIKELA